MPRKRKIVGPEVGDDEIPLPPYEPKSIRGLADRVRAIKTELRKVPLDDQAEWGATVKDARLIINGKSVYSDEALERVTLMAACGQLQRSIASHLKIKYKHFSEDVSSNKGDNEVCLAWERGHAAHEQVFANLVMETASGNSKGAIIALIFYAKSILGWRDRESAQVNLNSGVTLVLPHGLTREEYYAKLGIKGPTVVGDKSAPKPAAPTDPLQIELKDITPVLAPLMMPPTP